MTRIVAVLVVEINGTEKRFKTESVTDADVHEVALGVVAGVTDSATSYLFGLRDDARRRTAREQRETGTAA